MAKTHQYELELRLRSTWKNPRGIFRRSSFAKQFYLDCNSEPSHLLFSHKSCPSPCDPMDCSTPGFPVLHCLPELAETHVHRVSDAIQSSHPLSSPFPPVINPSHIRVFSNESTLHMRWPKYWSFSFSIIPSKEHPGLISFRIDWLDLLAVQRALKSLLQHHS